MLFLLINEYQLKITALIDDNIANQFLSDGLTAFACDEIGVDITLAGF
jgi:hypothetical protein